MLSIHVSIPIRLETRPHGAGRNLKAIDRVRPARIEALIVVHDEPCQIEVVLPDSFDHAFGQLVAAVAVVMRPILKRPVEILTQGAFLLALGTAERAEALKRANPDRADAIAADLSRLAAPDQMGDIFKLLCVSSAGVSPYPFAAQTESP